MNIDTEDLTQALENFDERVLELAGLPLDELYYPLLNSIRIQRTMSWDELAAEANARPWRELHEIYKLSLADITNYLVWLAKNSPKT